MAPSYSILFMSDLEERLLTLPTTGINITKYNCANYHVMFLTGFIFIQGGMSPPPPPPPTKLHLLVVFSNAFQHRDNGYKSNIKYKLTYKQETHCMRLDISQG